MAKKKTALIFSGVMLLLIMLAVSVGSTPTPKTVDQFISNYNNEIKNTAGKRVEKYGGYSTLTSRCTLKNIESMNGIKMALIYDSSGESAFMSHNNANSFDVGFTLNKDISSDAIFSIIEAAILAAGDNDNEVANKLGILSGNQYHIPGEYQREISLNGKKYSLASFDNHIILLVVIPK